MVRCCKKIKGNKWNKLQSEAICHAKGGAKTQLLSCLNKAYNMHYGQWTNMHKMAPKGYSKVT